MGLCTTTNETCTMSVNTYCPSCMGRLRANLIFLISIACMITLALGIKVRVFHIVKICWVSSWLNACGITKNCSHLLHGFNNHSVSLVLMSGLPGQNQRGGPQRYCAWTDNCSFGSPCGLVPFSSKLHCIDFLTRQLRDVTVREQVFLSIVYAGCCQLMSLASFSIGKGHTHHHVQDKPAQPCI